MKGSGDDIANFVISKDLAKSCKGAHKRYAAALEAKREEEQKNKAEKTRKIMQEEIKEVKRQKISLEASILYLREKADKLAFESKKAKNLEGMKGLITESNALKKSVIEKEMQVANLNKAINNLRKELSDN